MSRWLFLIFIITFAAIQMSLSAIAAQKKWRPIVGIRPLSLQLKQISDRYLFYKQDRLKDYKSPWTDISYTASLSEVSLFIEHNRLTFNSLEEYTEPNSNNLKNFQNILNQIEHRAVLLRETMLLEAIDWISHLPNSEEKKKNLYHFLSDLKKGSPKSYLFLRLQGEYAPSVETFRMLQNFRMFQLEMNHEYSGLLSHRRRASINDWNQKYDDYKGLSSSSLLTKHRNFDQLFSLHESLYAQGSDIDLELKMQSELDHFFNFWKVSYPKSPFWIPIRYFEGHPGSTDPVIKDFQFNWNLFRSQYESISFLCQMAFSAK